MRVQWSEGRDHKISDVLLTDISVSTPMIDSMSEIPVDPDGNPRPQCEDSPTPGIEILGATEFDHLFARDEIIETFTLGFGECSGLLGATMEVTALEDAGEIETINPKRRTSKQ